MLSFTADEQKFTVHSQLFQNIQHYRRCRPDSGEIQVISVAQWTNKKNYREVKDHNGETGRGRKACRFYKELDVIMGHRPASVPTAIFDRGSSIQQSSTTAPNSQADTKEDERNGNHNKVKFQYYNSH